MKTLHWHLKTDEDNIAWLHFDMQDSSSNVLNEDSLAELGELTEKLHKKSPAGLVILSDKPAGFIAGADVHRFQGLRDQNEALKLIERAHEIFLRIESLPCPSVALVHGYCLGGGLELSLACDYILVRDDEHTHLGLPEVKLGIHPGFGGTVRAIRRIGAVAALPLMLTGRTLSAHSAMRMGIADEKIAERHFLTAAKRYIHTKPDRRRAPWWEAIFRLPPVRTLFARLLEKRVRAKARPEHYPAPYALIRLWQKYATDESQMYEAERQSVAKLITGDTAQNLVRLFMLRERLKGFGKSEHSQTVRHVHVVGGGVMGGDIAAWCALRGIRVTLQDAHLPAIASSIKRAHALYKHKLKTPRAIRAAMDRLIPDPDGEGIPHADVVIEAIFENLEAKQKLFSDLETRVKPDAVLATNTSSLPLDDISSVLKTPSRLVGLHFFNPVAQMPLVEIVHAEGTDPDMQARAAAFTLQIDKLTLPVKSAPGFLVNRILMPYLLEAVTLVEEGVPAREIDKAALSFGMPMGPIRLADQVGLDICLSVADILGKELGFPVPKRLRELVAAGRLGKKTGQGFYSYQNGKVKSDASSQTGTVPDDITDRLMCSLFNEAVHCLHDKIVADSELVDAGVVFGTGFAPHLGGPMHYMNAYGSDSMIKTMHALEKKYGERFRTDEQWDDWMVIV